VVTCGVKAWKALGEQNDDVFCGAYGDVILSSDTAQCSVRPPPGCDILLCPLILLKKHFDDVNGKCCKQQGRKNFVWVYTGTPFDCGVRKEGKSCNGRDCWDHQLQCMNRPVKLVKKDRLMNERNIRSVSFDTNGAVGFGKIQNVQARSNSRATVSASGGLMN